MNKPNQAPPPVQGDENGLPAEVEAVQATWREWVLNRHWPSRSQQTERLVLMHLLDALGPDLAVQTTNREIGRCVNIRPQTISGCRPGPRSKHHRRVVGVGERLERFGIVRELNQSEEDGYNLATVWRFPVEPPDDGEADTSAPIRPSRPTSSTSRTPSVLVPSTLTDTARPVGALVSSYRLDLYDEGGVFSHRALGPHARVVIEAALNGVLRTTLHPVPTGVVGQYPPPRPRLVLTARDLVALVGCSFRTAQRTLLDWERRFFVLGRRAGRGWEYMLDDAVTEEALVGEDDHRSLELVQGRYMTPAEITAINTLRQRMDHESMSFASQRGSLPSTWPDRVQMRREIEAGLAYLAATDDTGEPDEQAPPGWSVTASALAADADLAEQQEPPSVSPDWLVWMADLVAHGRLPMAPGERDPVLADEYGARTREAA